MMRAGRLRHRVAIQSVVETRNSFGEMEQVWSTDLTVWGQVRPLSGNERNESGQVRAEVTHEVTLRYGFAITTANRLLVNGSRVFEISAVIDVDERRREYRISCRETGA